MRDPDDLSTEVREALRNVMRTKGIRRKELAFRLGVVPSAVSNMFRPRGALSLRKVESIADALDVEVHVVVRDRNGR